MSEANNPGPAERERERRRQYRAANRDKINAQKRAWGAVNRGKISEQDRRYREANGEQISERKRRDYSVNRDEIRGKHREYYQANRDERLAAVKTYADANRPLIQERKRKYYQVNGVKVRWKVLERAHGAGIEIEWLAMWEAQRGRCYLCGRDMDPADVHVEHWHGCSRHVPKQSCRYCRRGLAHSSCNFIVGHAADDPDLLRIIADNLERANAEVMERQRAAPPPITLF